MTSSTARDRILARLRACAAETQALAPVGLPEEEPAAIDRFAAELGAVSGRFHSCPAIADLAGVVAEILARTGGTGAVRWRTPLLDVVTDAGELRDRTVWTPAPAAEPTEPELDAWRRAASEAALGLTEAEFGICDTGTVVLGSDVGRARLASLLPPVHVVLLAADRLLANLSSLLAVLAGEQRALLGTCLTLITGPSRTADIEKRLVLGAHGPAELHVVVYGRST